MLSILKGLFKQADNHNTGAITANSSDDFAKLETKFNQGTYVYDSLLFLTERAQGTFPAIDDHVDGQEGQHTLELRGEGWQIEVSGVGSLTKDCFDDSGRFIREGESLSGHAELQCDANKTHKLHFEKLKDIKITHLPIAVNT